MKIFKKILVSLLLALPIIGIASCSEKIDPTVLETPVLDCVGNTISWKKIENATGYIVKLGDDVVSEQSTNSYTVKESEIGDYVYTVQATSTDTTNYQSSAFSEPFTFKIQEYMDVAKSLILTDSYSGKSFKSDGIGLATLNSPTDGDTARFNLTVDGGSEAIRFAGIDTPESTTREIGKWGKTAALYTKDRLQNAYEIVLEATTIPASMDSYNSRYMGYVWYRNSASEEFINLNMELLCAGYASIYGVSTSDKYYKEFNAAQANAKLLELGKWGDSEDPNYKEFKTTIKEILNDATLSTPVFYDTVNDFGYMVSFEGYVKTKSGNSFTVTQTEDGVEYSLTVYADSGDTAVSMIKEGQTWHFFGCIRKSGNTYRVSIDKSYNAFATGDTYTYKISN